PAAQRADHGGATTRLRQPPRDPLRATGLAVRAGDGDHLEALARPAVVLGRDRAGQLAQPRDGAARDRAGRRLRVALVEHRSSAAGDRLPDVVPAVVARTAPRDE